jgi:hypothetical protein
MNNIKSNMLINLIDKLSIYFRTIKFNDNKDTLVDNNELLSDVEHRKSLIHSFILDCNINDDEVEILSDDEVCRKLVQMSCSLSDVKLQNKIANITSEYSDELILYDFYDFVGAKKSNDSKMAIINFLTAQYYISKGVISPYNRTIFICKDNATAEKIKEVLMYITDNFYNCNLDSEYDIFSNNIVITTDNNYDIHAGVNENCFKNTNVVNVDILASETDCFDVFIDLAKKHQKEFDIFFKNLYGTVLVLQHKNSYV